MKTKHPKDIVSEAINESRVIIAHNTRERISMMNANGVGLDAIRRELVNIAATSRSTWSGGVESANNIVEMQQREIALAFANMSDYQLAAI